MKRTSANNEVFKTTLGIGYEGAGEDYRRAYVTTQWRKTLHGRITSLQLGNLHAHLLVALCRFIFRSGQLFRSVVKKRKRLEYWAVSFFAEGKCDVMH